jgi:hypothetical protein
VGDRSAEARIDPEDVAKVLPELRFEGLTQQEARAAIEDIRRKITLRTDRLFHKYIIVPQGRTSTSNP